MSNNRLSDLQERILTFILREKFATSQELLQKFWGDTIDQGGYASAHSSLSRVLTKLWSRGQIIIWKTITHSNTGVSLTAEGFQTAEKIMRQKQIS